MLIRKSLATVVAILSLAALVAAPASAERFPESPGQPALSGYFAGEEAHGVIHCQPLAELFGGGPYAPGTYPGVVVVNPNRTVFGGQTCLE